MVDWLTAIHGKKMVFTIHIRVRNHLKPFSTTPILFLTVQEIIGQCHSVKSHHIFLKFHYDLKKCQNAKFCYLYWLILKLLSVKKWLKEDEAVTHVHTWVHFIEETSKNILEYMYLYIYMCVCGMWKMMYGWRGTDLLLV